MEDLSFEGRIKQLDELIEFFSKKHEEFPRAGFDRTLQDLRNQRAELASKIGKKS